MTAPETAGQAAEPGATAYSRWVDVMATNGVTCEPFGKLGNVEQMAWREVEAIAAAAPAPAGEGSLRADLEETLANWREDALYHPADTHDEIVDHCAVTACADTLAGILADHPEQPQAAPGSARQALEEAVEHAIQVTPAGSGTSAVMRAVDAYVFARSRDAQAALDLARAETASVKAAAANTAREHAADVELLRQAADKLWGCAKAALTVEHSLDKPYDDDPRWSPWTRWVERPAREAHDLAMVIRKRLKTAPEPQDQP